MAAKPIDMNKSSFPSGLYAITDSSLAFDELLHKTESVLKGGARAVQFRDKNTDTNYDKAVQLFSLCKSYDAVFIINDDPQLASKLGVGVHLGKMDAPLEQARALLGKDATIGVSCYNDLALAKHAVDQGADYLAFGSFYASPTKPQAIIADREILTKASQLGLPVVAIGGITPENGIELVAAGADSLAVISGLYQSHDPRQAAMAYSQLFN